MTSSPVIKKKPIPINLHPLSEKNHDRKQDELRVSHVPQDETNNYIELQMDNLSEDSQENQPLETENKKGTDAKYFSQLKSHRQEQRRPFSPPFVGNSAEKEEVEKTSFQKKLDFLQVQRAQVFHDSLDALPSSIKELIGQSVDKPDTLEENKTTRVMNEDG